MASDDTATTGVDDPAAAAAGIVTHAESVCADADHLWTVLSRLAIPTDLLVDQRQQHKISIAPRRWPEPISMARSVT